MRKSAYGKVKGEEKKDSRREGGRKWNGGGNNSAGRWKNESLYLRDQRLPGSGYALEIAQCTDNHHNGHHPSLSRTRGLTFAMARPAGSMTALVRTTSSFPKVGLLPLRALTDTCRAYFNGTTCEMSTLLCVIRAGISYSRITSTMPSL